MQKKRLEKKHIKKIFLQIGLFAFILFAVLGLFALKAYAACEHQFYNGVCVHCGYACQSCSSGQGQEYRYEYAQLNGNKHTVYRLCTDCRVEYNEGLEDCTFNSQNVCTKCGVVCKHPNFVDGACTVCGHVCGHSKSINYYTYETTPSNSITHTIRAWCSICHQRNYSDPHNGEYETCQFDPSDGICPKCDRHCEHPEFSDNYCQKCGFYCEHYVMHLDTCEVCGYKCTHNHGVIDSFEPVDRQSHIKFSCCVICSYIFNQYTVPHGNNYTETYTDIGDSYLHKVTFYCKSCDYLSTEEAEHVFTGSSCMYCNMVCKHPHFDTHGYCTLCRAPCPHDQGYTDGLCNRCTSVCKHSHFEKSRYNTKEDTIVYWCYDCDLTYEFFAPFVNFEYYDTAGFSNLHFNLNRQLLWEDPDSTVPRPRFYDHYTITNFSEKLDFNGAIHLIGGNNITDSAPLDVFQDPVAGRFLVFRMRKQGITHLEWTLYGGDEPKSFSDINTQCASAYFSNVEQFPDNEWFDLVIDLKSFDVFNDSSSTYTIGESISHALAVLCCTFETKESYIDIEYFSICNTWNDVDSVSHWLKNDPVRSDFFLVQGRYAYSTQRFHPCGDDNVCDACGYACDHSYEHIIDDVLTNTECGRCETCYLCYTILSNTVDYHYFADNSYHCKRCDYVCNHSYNNGVCIYCEWTCTHLHLDGSIRCSFCGRYVNPDGIVDDDGFFNLFTAIYDAQANTFFKMLGYEIFGVNIAGLIVSVIALAIVIWLLKKVL